MTEACSSMTFMVSYDPMIGEDTARNTQKLTMALHNPDVSRDHSVGVCVMPWLISVCFCVLNEFELCHIQQQVHDIFWKVEGKYK